MRTLRRRSTERVTDEEGRILERYPTQISQEVLDAALLEAISGALDEQLVEAAVERALERLRSRQGQTADRRHELQRELSLVEAPESGISSMR